MTSRLQSPPNNGMYENTNNIMNIPKTVSQMILYFHTNIISECVESTFCLVIGINRCSDLLHNVVSSSVLFTTYKGVSKSFRAGCLEQELQMVQLCATRCSFIAILWGSLVSFVTITLCVASQWVFIFTVVYFIIDSVRKLLDTP
jgi:hypothetical protein